MAANQVVSGSLVSWNTVPAVSRTCRLQRLHWNSVRVVSRQRLLCPQAGQLSLWRQRICKHRQLGSHQAALAAASVLVTLLAGSARRRVTSRKNSGTKKVARKVAA